MRDLEMKSIGLTTNPNAVAKRAVNGLVLFSALACLTVGGEAEAGTGNVVAWHDNSYGQTNIPAGLSNVVAIAAGGYFSVALNQDGTVVGWGDNTLGQITVPFGLSNVVQVSAGGSYFPNAGGNAQTLALKGDGTVAGWGYVTPPSGLTNIVSIACGESHGLGLTSAGAVIGWGVNFYGESTMPSGLSNVLAIAAGGNRSGILPGGHSLALRNDHTVIAWGRNDRGQTNVPANLTNVVAIAAGGLHSLALKGDGTVVGWGYDGNGQATPPQGLTNVIALSANMYASLALKNDGTVIGWGEPFIGPVDVPSGLSNVVATSAGVSHGVALTQALPPILTLVRQPTPRTVYSGETAHLGFVLGLGLPPFSYHWQQEGTNVPGATNSWLIINSAQQASAGTYRAAVSNVQGNVLSSNVTLTVIDSLPIITSQPTNRLVLLGTNSQSTTFNVGAVGSLPMTFQWYFNDTAIDQATNSFLTTSNLQANQTGNYRVVISNAFGITISSNALLAFPPNLIVSPSSQAAGIGTNTQLAVVATGSGPLIYHWQFEGSDIVDATDSVLVVTNVEISDRGNYRVAVSNSYGFVISSNAYLSPMDLGNAANAPDLVWTTSGQGQWYWQTNISHDGIACLKSGLIGASQQSILQTTVVGASTLTFWWKVSSLATFHTLIFSVNGVEQTRISGEVDWQQKTIYLGNGTNVLQWTYSKNSFSPAGQDAAWLDEVHIQPGGTAATIANDVSSQTVPAGTDVTFNISAFGTPPLSYQWRYNATNLIGPNTSALLLPNVQSSTQGVYSVRLRQRPRSEKRRHYFSSWPAVWVEPSKCRLQIAEPFECGMRSKGPDGVNTYQRSVTDAN